MGTTFRSDLGELVECLQRDIPKAFETEEYKDALTSITQELEAQRNRILQGVQQRAAAANFAILRTPDGLMITPLVDGQPIPAEAYESLPPEQREELAATRRSLERKLDDALSEVMRLEQESRESIVSLDQRVTASVADRFVQPLIAKYPEEPEVGLHLDLLRQDVVNHIDAFRPADREEEAQQEDPAAPLRRYQVNLFVDNRGAVGAPVIVESNPTLHNLMGRIEYEVRYGAATTDFTLIKAGSLQRANGGYLVLRASELLGNSSAWSALKRALTDQAVRVEEPAAESMATKSLDAEPIPLRVKIVLLGSPALYYALYGLEDDFVKLFKVKADFDAQMERTPQNEDEYALFVATRCHEEGLRHFGPGAVGKVVEHGSRLAGTQTKLTTRFGQVADLIREASFWAGKAVREVVDSQDVDRAVREQIHRSDLTEEHLRRQIVDGTILIDTDGAVVGQVNGLYVVQVGDHRFGHPSRITAQAYMGRSGVLSIEREVEMAGPLHNRGVLTLTGYLGGTYAQNQPLSLSASIAFEQNYGGIEGDSASLAELCALLSRLSALPVDQGIAVTGSVNQWGQVQPIGGVTEKVEGFFATCQAPGLSGRQGVIVPAANLQDLMLHQEIVAAVAETRFSIWAVDHVDQAIQVLTGTPAGVRSPDGDYPAGTLHHAVQSRLTQLATELARFGNQKGAGD